MTTARRAALEAPDVTVTTSSPRRGRAASLVPALRRGLAPAAIVGLLAVTTALTFVPMGAGDTTSVADPLAAHDARVANRASREFDRVPVPTVSASPTVAAALPIPSPSPATSVAATSATPTPSAVASVATPAPAPAASSPAAEPVAATPEVDWSVEGKDVGPRWATDSVNVRTGPGTGHDVVTALAADGEVTITESEHDGWQQVSLKSGAGWVKASFLTDDEPAAETQDSSTASTSSSDGASGAVAAAGSCSNAGSAENGMTSSTVSVLRQVCAQFSSITSYGGYRAGSGGYHGSGQAIDAMISGEAGWEVARWVRANASSLGVVEVIYQQKIWTSQRSGDGWRGMSDRGSASANHYDHVHISVG